MMHNALFRNAGLMAVTLLCLGCLLTSCSALSGQGGELYWGLFIEGHYQGNLKKHSLHGANYVRAEDGTYFLHMNTPGSSSATFTFPLKGKPAEYYVLIDMIPNPACIDLEVNGQAGNPIGYSGFNDYKSWGYEISNHLREGDNTVAVKLCSPEGELKSEQVKLRGIVFTADPTTMGSEKGLPAVISPYAKAFGIILLVLVVLYFIWTLFNRALYRNLDTYSASFSLIGIMIMSVATAYAVLLTKDKIAVTVTLFACIAILTIAAVLSEKRDKSTFEKNVEAGTGSESSGSDRGGGDFNF